MRHLLTALRIGACDVEPEHAHRIRRTDNAHGCPAVSNSFFKPQPIGKRAAFSQAVCIRPRTACCRLNDGLVFAVHRGHRQIRCVEHELAGRDHGHACPVTIGDRFGAQVRLRDAAVIPARIASGSVLTRQRGLHFAFKRNAFALLIGGIEPLIAQRMRCRRTGSGGLVVEHGLRSIRRNRQRQVATLVQRLALRLRIHLRCTRLDKRKRKRLRRVHVRKPHRPAAALIRGNIQVNGHARRAVCRRLGHADPLQIAALVGLRRKRRLPAGNNRLRLRHHRASLGLSRHLIGWQLRKTRNHRHVVFGNKRPVGAGAQRLSVLIGAFAHRIPSSKRIPCIGHSVQRERLAVFHRAHHREPKRVNAGGALDMPALTRVDSRHRPRAAHVIRCVRFIAQRGARGQRAERNRAAVFVNPIAELPARLA